MAKDPLNTPFQRRIMETPPGKTEHACNYLEHTMGGDLAMKSDTSVLKEAFYSAGDSLKWSKGALNSPMGTSIPNPKQ
jgi:hypothetical protein